ncbi:MAG TPA: hypothetical protein VGN34_09440 [Ktedonobacteraceae bacterium]|jgi:hypothetical protein
MLFIPIIYDMTSAPMLRTISTIIFTNIATWSTHITDARSTMQSILGTALPVMITSWNYTSQVSLQSNGTAYNDGKDSDTNFINNWTSKALHTLADNHVFASMQYAVTSTALPLIAKDTTLTTMGTTFQTLYLQMVARQDFNG